MFKIDKGVDTGLICYQHNMPIDEMDTYEILENKRQKGIQTCFWNFIDELADGVVVLRKQSGRGNYQVKRNPKVLAKELQ